MNMTRLRLFIRWRRLPRSTRKILTEACFYLLITRVLLTFFKLSKISCLLRNSTNKEEQSDISLHKASVLRISAAVKTMNRYTPWKNSCLVQACAAKFMLNRRGLPGYLYFGVAKDKDNRLIAHAWLSCGNLDVTGGEVNSGFKITGVIS